MDEGCEVDEVVVDFASEMLAMADGECARCSHAGAGGGFVCE